MIMRIDTHTHIGESKIFASKDFLKPKNIVNIMDRNQIDKAFLIPTASPPRPRYYEDVVEALKEFPDRFYGFFLANPKERNVCDLLDMVVNTYGFLGVKLHPTFLAFAIDDQELVYPIMEKVRELKICVVVHSDPFLYATPWQVGLLAMDFPDIPIVMAHMGFVDVIFADAAIKMARRAPNLYLDTTGVSADTKVTAAARAIGASRILCGSDSPFTNPAFAIARIECTELSDQEKKLILGENAKRLMDSLGRK
jgi:predicted TIM-barrel fold metal-dependent hydrolase